MRLLRKVTALATVFALAVTVVPLGASAKEEYMDENGYLCGITEDGMFDYVIYDPDDSYPKASIELRDSFYKVNDDGTLSCPDTLVIPCKIGDAVVDIVKLYALQTDKGVTIDGKKYYSRHIKDTVSTVLFDGLVIDGDHYEDIRLYTNTTDPFSYRGFLLEDVKKVGFLPNCQMEYVCSQRQCGRLPGGGRLQEVAQGKRESEGKEDGQGYAQELLEAEEDLFQGKGVR